MSAPTRFIRPDVLARLGTLELVARAVVEGFMAGLHQSPYKGFSVEFMEYRPYMPGDDPLRIDWKLFARTDRLYVKEFEDETNTRMHLLVDISRSMHYGSGTVNKQTYASYLAASLAYFIDRQQDAVGLTLFDHDVRDRLPARRAAGHLPLILKHLEDAPPGAQTNLGKPLHLLADLYTQRGFVVLISDLLDDVDPLVDGLKHFRYNGHEVIVFHLLDPQEVHFDFEDEAIEFEDLETGATKLVLTREARDVYRDNVSRFCDTLKRACSRLGIDYTLLTTDQPLDHALFHYLAARSRRA
ncbi:DUF58 domain-containing protein [Rhodothermaceae bacterium RA]|nr:DUF58 domain-containing protein [Rhodothermaceae bacterium RA]